MMPADKALLLGIGVTVAQGHGVSSKCWGDGQGATCACSHEATSGRHWCWNRLWAVLVLPYACDDGFHSAWQDGRDRIPLLQGTGLP
jgi:hypothetical protein